jgi:hypothetical protein
VSQNPIFQWFRCYHRLVARGSTRGNISFPTHSVTSKVTPCYQSLVTPRMPSRAGLYRLLPLLPQIKIYPTLSFEERITRGEHMPLRPWVLEDERDYGETTENDMKAFLSRLSEDDRYAFEERAAIMEVDGGLTREEAEHMVRINLHRKDREVTK